MNEKVTFFLLASGGQDLAVALGNISFIFQTGYYVLSPTATSLGATLVHTPTSELPRKHIIPVWPTSCPAEDPSGRCFAFQGNECRVSQPQ